jgi:hypothetical protein
MSKPARQTTWRGLKLTMILGSFLARKSFFSRNDFFTTWGVRFFASHGIYWCLLLLFIISENEKEDFETEFKRASTCTYALGLLLKTSVKGLCT